MVGSYAVGDVWALVPERKAGSFVSTWQAKGHRENFLPSDIFWLYSYLIACLDIFFHIQTKILFSYLFYISYTMYYYLFFCLTLNPFISSYLCHH